MARYKAILGAVRQGANAFAELEEWDLDESANDIQATVIGSPVGAVDPGPVTYTLTASGFYDEADAGMAAIAAGQENVEFTVFPRGIGTGLPQAIGNYNVLSFRTSAQSEDKVKFTLRAVSDGTAALDKTAQT